MDYLYLACKFVGHTYTSYEHFGSFVLGIHAVQLMQLVQAVWSIKMIHAPGQSSDNEQQAKKIEHGPRSTA